MTLQYPLSSTNSSYIESDLFVLFQDQNVSARLLGASMSLPTKIREVATYLFRAMSLPKPSNLASRSLPLPLHPTHPGPDPQLAKSCLGDA